MEFRISKFYRTFLLLSDIFLLNLAFLLAFLLKFEEIRPLSDDEYIVLVILMNAFWILIGFSLGVYRIHRAIRMEKVPRDLLKALLLYVVLISAIIFLIKGYYYSRMQLGLTFLLFVSFVSVWRLFFWLVVQKFRAIGFNYRKVIIVGGGPVGQRMYHEISSHPEYGYKFLGFFDDSDKLRQGGNGVLGTVEEAKEYALQEEVDEIFCALPPTATGKIKDMMQFADNYMLRFKIIPDFRGFLNKRVNIDFYGDTPVLTVRHEPLESTPNRLLKRAFDLFFSTLVILLVLSWLLPILALLIKLETKGPVFFNQQRSGLKNRVFRCFKLRTMKQNGDADAKQATRDDPRITKIGRWLRRSNLDELPQFFNVLLGDMSVVGPRPHMLKHTKEYSRIIDRFMVRHLIKPGITGWAQVNGYRGATEDPMLMRKRVQYDVWYLEHWSFLLDLKIIWLTVWRMLRGDKQAV